MTNRNYLNTNIILFFSFFTLCFDNIPKFLQVNFISIGLSNKLSWYPLFILLCVYIYQRLKNRKNISRIWEERATVRYLLLYVGIILISTILGFICYPYYDVIFNGPIGQIEKLPSVMNDLVKHFCNTCV
jgi:phosphatidylglycerophosphatase A